MTTVSSQFPFPKYVAKAADEVNGFEQELGTIMVGKTVFVVTIQRPTDLAQRVPNLPFLVSKVEHGGV
ncbi:hypothetical protein EBR66_04385 [bacterium]|nr:hypothetical protein [bacterium]